MCFVHKQHLFTGFVLYMQLSRHIFLTLVLGSQLHVSAVLPQGKGRAPGTHWIGGWLGPRAGLNAVAERETLLGIKPWSSSQYPSQYTDKATPAAVK
jgi:hypothetical protein